MTQTIALVGTLDFDGSKHLERYVNLHCESPYPHDVCLTIVADEGQDDEALTTALDAHLQNTPVLVVATMVDGDLRVRISDVAAAEALPDEPAVRDLVETADYLVDRYRTAWQGRTVRDLAEAEAAYNSAKAKFILVLNGAPV